MPQRDAQPLPQAESPVPVAFGIAWFVKGELILKDRGHDQSAEQGFEARVNKDLSTHAASK